MARKAISKSAPTDLDWVILSYSQVRKWILIGLLVAACGVWGFVLYRRSHVSPEVRAERQIAEAEAVLVSAEKSEEASRFTATLSQARDRIADARSALTAAQYPRAYDLAVESESLSRRALGRSARADMGDATFVALDGEVTLQRAGRTTFEECRLRQALFDGDFVKTSRNGSAEIMFSDGTLYQIRPDSLFEVKATERSEHEKSSSVEMVSGSIQVYTANSPTNVRTKSATAEIQRESQAGISIDEQKNTDVSAFRGEAVVRTARSSVVLSERQQVRADAATQSFGEKMTLPEAPAPVDPADNRVFDTKRDPEITLRWTPIPAAARYRLQVSRSRLFIPDATPLDLPDRRGVSAAIRPHEEGSYYWRVAAINVKGVASDWSAYRRFRLVSDAGREATPAGAPPPLYLEAPRQMGNLFLILGKTDPGASVTVAGNRADVEADGTFKTTVSVDTEGESQIVVKAADAAGRETVRRIRVFVENY